MLLFENFNEIHKICKEYNIENYTINQDGSIDVDGNVNLNEFNLTNLPLKFNKVLGYFNCNDNRLTTLEGSPREVGGWFGCSNNKLNSLKGGPEKVGGNFYCFSNNLTSLEGLPREMGMFNCANNPIINIIYLFKDYKEFKNLLDDYNYIRGTRIIKHRFMEACIDAGIKMPENIEGYDII